MAEDAEDKMKIEIIDDDDKIESNDGKTRKTLKFMFQTQKKP
jgi:hypothetical protein